MLLDNSIETLAWVYILFLFLPTGLSSLEKCAAEAIALKYSNQNCSKEYDSENSDLCDGMVKYEGIL